MPLPRDRASHLSELRSIKRHLQQSKHLFCRTQFFGQVAFDSRTALFVTKCGAFDPKARAFRRVRHCHCGGSCGPGLGWYLYWPIRSPHPGQVTFSQCKGSRINFKASASGSRLDAALAAWLSDELVTVRRLLLEPGSGTRLSQFLDVAASQFTSTHASWQWHP